MDIINKNVEYNESADCFTIDAEGDSNNVDNNETVVEFKIEVDQDISQNSEVINGAAEYKVDCLETTTLLDDVPVYDTKFTGFLDTKEFSIETGKHIPNDAKPKKMCFNCLGDHNINECVEKKNFKDIARNRQNILGRKMANVRYHEEVQNKYGNVVPGKISDSLRSALGLRDHDAPEFIYRMRVLGYPPGWLKEAEVRRSDVCLFDGDGKELGHPEDEEGEADVQTIKYQPEKLITFPGFNAPFPRYIKDDHHYYRCPRMQPHHRKEEFERLMIMNRVAKYKRKKLKVSDTPQSLPSNSLNKKRAIFSGEMEIDDSELVANTNIEFNPPLPAEELPPLPAEELSPLSAEQLPPLPAEKLPSLHIEKSQKSPSLTVNKDKEEGEFSENSSESTHSNSIAAASGEGIDCPTTIPSTDRLSPSISDIANGQSIKNNPGDTLVKTVTMHSKSKTKRHHRSLSKGFSLGVPIPESITPFKTLPNPEKWSVDVSDHLLFENLPDALGTWSKMKGLVQTVRKCVEAFNAEED